jgi:hypothetical protein
LHEPIEKTRGPKVPGSGSVDHWGAVPHGFDGGHPAVMRDDTAALSQFYNGDIDVFCQGVEGGFFIGEPGEGAGFVFIGNENIDVLLDN